MTECECPLCGTSFCAEESQDATPYLLDCGHSICRKCCARLRSLACPQCSSSDSFDVDGPVFNVICPTCHDNTAATDENGRLRMDFVTAAFISCFGNSKKASNPPSVSADAKEPSLDAPVDDASTNAAKTEVTSTPTEKEKPSSTEEPSAALGDEGSTVESKTESTDSAAAVVPDSAKGAPPPPPPPAAAAAPAATTQPESTSESTTVVFPEIPRRASQNQAPNNVVFPAVPPRPAKKESLMMCPKHNSERKLYCQTCQTLCCPMCASPGGDHHRHMLIVREAAQRELVETLRDNIAKLQQALPVNNLERLQEVIKGLGDAKDRVGTQAKDATDSLKDGMDARKEVLLESLDGKIDSLVGGLQAQADLMKESFDKAEKLIERSNSYLVCMDANVAKVPEIVKLVWDLYNLRPELEQLSVQYIPTEAKLTFKTDGNALMYELKNYGYFSHNPPRVESNPLRSSSSAVSSQPPAIPQRPGQQRQPPPPPYQQRPQQQTAQQQQQPKRPSQPPPQPQQQRPGQNPPPPPYGQQWPQGYGQTYPYGYSSPYQQPNPAGAKPPSNPYAAPNPYAMYYPPQPQPQPQPGMPAYLEGLRVNTPADLWKLRNF